MVKFLPALKTTSSPLVTSVLVAVPSTVPPSAAALAFQPELLIAVATSAAVAKASPAVLGFHFPVVESFVKVAFTTSNFTEVSLFAT